MAACSSFASLGKVMAFSRIVVSTVTRLRSWLGNALASCATPEALRQQQLQLSPSRLRQWLEPERSCGKASWKNSSTGEELEI